MKISITNADGQPVANLKAPGAPGFGRVVWDLKPTKDLLTEYGGEGALFVRPGDYTVTLTYGKTKAKQTLGLRPGGHRDPADQRYRIRSRATGVLTPRRSGRAVGGLGDREVLDAEAREVGDDDLLGSRAPRRIAERAELDRAVPLGEGVLELPQPLALRPGIDEEERGAAEDLRVELLLARRVGADGEDERPRAHVGRAEQRRTRRRRRDHQERAGGDLRRRAGDADVHAREHRRDVAAARLGALGAAAPENDARKRQDLRVEPRLETRLSARADDPDHRVAAGKLAGRERGDGRGPHVGQPALVEKHRDRIAGRGRREGAPSRCPRAGLGRAVPERSPPP